MKKIMSKKIFNKNNRGIAMVTVLIAVTFIGILATSLMYMAFMNYKMKSLRYQSQDNFYTDEFALDEVAATLQQIAAKESSVDEAKKKIRQAVGAGGSVGSYNNAKVQDLIVVSDQQDGVEIKVETDTAAGTNSYIETDNSVTLKGLTLTAEREDGYTSTIVTDLNIQFSSSVPGDFDINDFSVITDSVYTTAGKHGTLVYAGCIYIRQRPGKDFALEATNGRCVTILSPLGIIDGDVKIKNAGGASSVSIGGNVTVDGDIYIEPNCTLIVTGSLTVTGTIHNSGKFLGEDHVSYMSSTDLNLPADGMASSLYAKHVFGIYNYNGNCRPIDLGVIANGTTDAERMWKSFPHKLPIDFIVGYGGEVQRQFTPYTDIHMKNNPYYVQINLPDQTYNGCDYPGIIMTVGDVNVKYTCYDTTILTLGDLKCNENGNITMAKMEPEAFYLCKRMMMNGKGGNKGTLGGSAGVSKHDFNGQNYYCTAYSENLADGPGDRDPKTWDEFCDYLLTCYNNGTINSKYKVYQYSAESGCLQSGSDGIIEPSKASMTWNEVLIESIRNSIDEDTRYAIFELKSDGTMSPNILMPYGYLLAPNSSNIINKYFNSTNNDVTPDKSTAVYQNWRKE